MRERAELLGGTLTVDAAPGEGVLVAVDLPLRDPERAP
jgi:signal transduction histidine kinase